MRGKRGQRCCSRRARPGRARPRGQRCIHDARRLGTAAGQRDGRTRNSRNTDISDSSSTLPSYLTREAARGEPRATLHRRALGAASCRCGAGRPGHGRDHGFRVVVGEPGLAPTIRPGGKRQRRPRKSRKAASSPVVLVCSAWSAGQLQQRITAAAASLKSKAHGGQTRRSARCRFSWRGLPRAGRAYAIACRSQLPPPSHRAPRSAGSRRRCITRVSDRTRGATFDRDTCARLHGAVAYARRRRREGGWDARALT